jgi:putative phage-type endonuclease
VRIVELAQRSEEWLKWRMNILTASRSAAITGESPHASAYDVWLEMTGRKAGFTGNLATDRGEAMEGAAKARYEIDNGFIDTVDVCVLHPTIDFIGASLDAIDMNTFILAELKYPSQKSHDLAVAGEVPRHYWIQVQHQLMCVPEAPYAHYWSHRDDNPAQIQIDPDKEYQAQLLKLLISFHELLKTDTPPPLTEADAKWMDDSDSLLIANQMIELKDADTKRAKQELDALKSAFIKMAGHNRVRCGRVLVSKSVTKTGKDSYRLTISGVGA